MSSTHWLERPALLLTLTTLFWGGNAVVGKLALNYMSGIELSFWRWVLAFLILLPFAWRACLRDMGYYRRHFRLLLLLALLSVSLYNSLQYVALHFTSAINVGVVSATMPLEVFLLTWLFGHERATWLQKLGMLLALVGVCWVVSRGDLQLLASLQLNPGDLLMLIAVTGFAIYSVLMKKLPAELDRLGLLLLLILLGICGILPFYLWDIQGRETFSLSMDTALILGYVGIFPSLLSYYFWNKAVLLGGANQAALFTNLISVFASLLAVIFLGEHFQSYHVVGMTTIFTAILLATYVSRWYSRGGKG
ncbi:DMT family transporter [Sedimenticola thiotaurini]|uniref:DMT family transporter n=1 Tax=Sedimenticola thiotaurini TaxID=1543721 RepID=UPI00069BA0D6|nr:DMT family transporter [Sedimenticola thiotaurini]